MRSRILHLLSIFAILSGTMPIQSMKNDDTHIDTTQAIDHFMYALSTCPNEIISYLDGKGFSSLTQVSKECQQICEVIPLKYFYNVSFSDVLYHGNEKFVSKFLDHDDYWLFDSNMQELEITSKTNDTIKFFKDNNIKFFKSLFKKELQTFLGNCYIYCVTRDNILLRAVVIWKNYKKDVFIWQNENKIPIVQTMCINYFNFEPCDITIAIHFGLNCNEEIINFYFNDKEKKEKGHGTFQLPMSSGEIGNGYKYAIIDKKLYTVQNLQKQLGVIMTFHAAAVKNYTTVVSAILNHPITNNWSPSILTKLNDMPNISEDVKNLIRQKTTNNYFQYMLTRMLANSCSTLDF